MAVTNFTAFANKSWAVGTHTSGSANYNGDAVVCSFVITCPTWASDTGVTVELACEQSFDSGATWVYSDAEPHNGPIFDQTYEGGGHLKAGAVGPGGSFTVSDGLGPRLVRALMTITGGSITLGVSGSTSA